LVVVRFLKHLRRIFAGWAWPVFRPARPYIEEYTKQTMTFSRFKRSCIRYVCLSVMLASICLCA